VKKIFSILFALVLVVGLGLIITAPVAAAPGTTYYVSAAGDDDTGDGTVGNPWRTIQKAIDALNFTGDGDTIMVGAGEYDAFLVDGKANIDIIGTDGATVTTAATHSILAELGVGYDLWGMAAVVDSENINIQGIGFDGTAINEEGIFGIAYFDSTGRIAAVAVAGLLGTVGVGAGVVIIDDLGLSDVEITGSTIAHNEIGIAVATHSIQEVHFNNIVYNSDYGLVNDAGDMVDATYNWWGDASGPYHPTLNPGGSGNPVDDDVFFEPWLEAESVTETVENDFVDAIDEADARVWVNGRATVTISTYESNPHPGADVLLGASASLNSDALQTDPEETDIFRDVYVTNYTAGTWIRIELYYNDAQAEGFIEDSLRVHWYNEDTGRWEECTESDVNTDPVSIGADDYSGYMWAIIRENGTTPSLDDLQGDEFGGYGHPSETNGGCGMATLADVTPFALVSVGIVAVWATKRKGKVS
jgi:hypothetical protein